MVLRLLDYINAWNLMTLRLVCKQTKVWVENPLVLNRLSVQVKERKFLQQLLRSKVNWSNLAVSCDGQDISGEWVKSDLYLKTFSKLSTSLRTLKLLEHRLPFSGFNIILGKCQNIQCFQVETLDVANAAGNLPFSEELTQKIRLIEKMEINYVAWGIERDLQFISEVLKNCENLRYFKIPVILMARLFSLYPNLDEIEIDKKLENLSKQALLLPLLNTLERECSPLKYLDVENYDTEELLSSNLLPACIKSGCLVMNLVESSERPFSQKEVELLSSSVSSILSCSEFLPLDKLYKLQRLEIDLASGSSDIAKQFRNEDTNPQLPSLQDIDLSLSNSILVSERLAACLLQKKRPSLKKVSVKFNDLKGSAQTSVFRPTIFANCLPNLKCLAMDGFDGKASDYLLFWKSFPLLEDLRLENCKGLGDEAFFEEVNGDVLNHFLSMQR